ncbi:hypothetical protein Q1M64_17665 [Sinorhizobium meliloti]|nr:hypothetical protein Q1M64_17665 [Sinorhizobium meliloti]
MPDGSRAVMVAKVAPRVSFAPACGEKVAGRPDEGQAEAMRACELRLG